MNWFFNKKTPKKADEVVVRFYLRDTKKTIDIYCIKPLTKPQ